MNKDYEKCPHCGDVYHVDEMVGVPVDNGHILVCEYCYNHEQYSYNEFELGLYDD